MEGLQTSKTRVMDPSWVDLELGRKMLWFLGQGLNLLGLLSEHKCVYWDQRSVCDR